MWDLRVPLPSRPIQNRNPDEGARFTLRVRATLNPHLTAENVKLAITRYSDDKPWTLHYQRMWNLSHLGLV
jgi:hypothetical protein